MQLTRSSRFRLAVVGSVLVITALAGCSSANGGGGGGGGKVALPDGVSGAAAVSTPSALPAEVKFTVGRDDAFLSDEAKADGSRGLVVAVKNTSDDDVRIGGSFHLGAGDAWNDYDGDILHAHVVGSGLPEGCKNYNVTSNNAYLGTSYGDPFKLAAGKTVYGCTILSTNASPEDGKLKVGFTDADNKDYTQTVDVGDLFEK